MTPRTEDAWSGTGHQISGPWQEVFGPGGPAAAVNGGGSRPTADSLKGTSAGRLTPAGTQDPRRSEPPRNTPEDGPGPDADPESVARAIVLRKLTAQDRTRQELNKALRARNVTEEVADRVLDRMEDVRLIDDSRFADSWVRSRQQRRGLSKVALRRELSGKGIDRETIDETLQSVDIDDEYSAALMLAQKKLRGMSGLDRQVQQRRLFGALARRGFSSALSGRVIDAVLGSRDA